MRRMRQKAVIAIFALLSGFLAGTLMPEFFRMGTGTYAGLLSWYSLGKYESVSVSPARLLPYIVSIRLKTLVFLWMSCYTSLGMVLHFWYAWWLAASAGLLLSLFMIRDGYGGLLLFFCCMFPQWLIYTSMWKQELLFLFQKSERAGEQAGVSSFRRDEIAGFARMAGLCLLGCAAESFLGTWTLKIFLQLFT